MCADARSGFKFPSYPENWSEIIKLVKKRDKYTCQKCFTKFRSHSTSLRVHHKIPISKWVKLGLKGSPHNPKNLTTICSECHKDEHPHLRMGDFLKNKRVRRTAFGYNGNKRAKFGFRSGKK